MKNVLTLSAIVLLCNFSTYAQDCWADAGEDSRTCDFRDTLIGMPMGGDWLYICQDSFAPINIVNLNDSTIIVNFSQCGSYAFEYFFNSDSCEVSDTVVVDFEDPSTSDFLIGLEIDLFYQDYNCPSDDSIACAAYQVEGAAPEPLWEFTPFGTCNSTIYSTTTQGDTVNCFVNEINVNMTTHSGTLSPNQSLTFQQSDFITLNGDEVVENNFFDLVDQGIILGLNLLADNCPTPARCLPLPPECRDTILDSLTLVIPVHLGGYWTLWENGTCVDLDSNNIFTIDSIDYLLSVAPSSETYNSSFQVLEITAAGDTTSIGQSVSFSFLWKENWILDTIMRVDTILTTIDSCCAGGTNITLLPFDIPPIPSYDCLPFTLTFFPELELSEPVVTCFDSTYIVTVSASGGLPPYFAEGLAGEMNGNVFTSDSIPFDQVDFEVTILDDGDCEDMISGNICPCLWGVDVAVFDLVTTGDCGVDSLGTLFANHISGGFPPFMYSLDSLNFQSDPFFDSLQYGTGMLYVKDSFNCITTLEFTIDSIPWMILPSLEKEFEVCVKEETLLDLSLNTLTLNSYIVEWNDGDTSKFRVIELPGTYRATVYDLLTCSRYQAVFTIKDISRFSLSQIALPNAFTPNRDGVNDNFSPVLKNEYVEYFNYNLNVFNRWGDRVFQTNNPDVVWQPEEKSASDVYVWFLETNVKTCDGRIFSYKDSGDLTLIR